MLARLDKIAGVLDGKANRSGTLVRISLAKSADPEKIAAKSIEVLADEKRKAVQLSGGDLIRALAGEQWYGPDELSAIEFRIVALDSVRAFAKSEKLDAKTTEKLTQIAQEEWDRLAKAAASVQSNRSGSPTNWKSRCAAFPLAFVKRARGELTPAQFARLRTAADCFLGGDSPDQ